MNTDRINKLLGKPISENEVFWKLPFWVDLRNSSHSATSHLIRILESVDPESYVRFGRALRIDEVGDQQDEIQDAVVGTRSLDISTPIWLTNEDLHNTNRSIILSFLDDSGLSEEICGTGIYNEESIYWSDQYGMWMVNPPNAEGDQQNFNLLVCQVGLARKYMFAVWVVEVEGGDHTQEVVRVGAVYLNRIANLISEAPYRIRRGSFVETAGLVDLYARIRNRISQLE